MQWQPLLESVFPAEAEKDEGFQQEIFRLSHVGLRLCAAATIVFPLLLALGRMLLSPDPNNLSIRLLEVLVLCVLGILMLLVSRVSSTYPHSRQMALLYCLLVATILIAFSLSHSRTSPYIEDYIPGEITFLMLGLVATVPVRPIQAFVLGIGMGVIYYSMARALRPTIPAGGAPESMNLLFIGLLSLVALGMSAVLYRQRYLTYQSFLQVMKATAEIREAQMKLMLSEHGASMGRLSAALSHELNSPIGALKSGVDTLLLVSERRAEAKPEELSKLRKMQADLSRTIEESLSRLQAIIGRIQRFSNMDRAEEQAADLNSLLADVAALTEPQLPEGAKMRLDQEPLPPFHCRPSQFSAVFHTLISNAAVALKPHGVVLIRTRYSEDGYLIEIADTGNGIPQQTLARIFDPSFRVSKGRVSTGNWGLFSARQVVREHGGDLDIRSAQGRGTTVYLKLPRQATTMEMKALDSVE